MKSIILVIKGFIMGIAVIIPGVSGGAIALILGIYEDFINAMGNFFKNLKKNIMFLLPVIIGIGLSILSTTNLISYSYDNFPIPTTMFFMGLVFGGIPMLYKRAKKQKTKNKTANYLIMVLSFSLVLFMACSSMIFDTTVAVSLSNMGVTGYVMLFLAGAVGAASMIIPGMSGGLVLMIMGYYYPVLDTIKDFLKLNDSFVENFIVLSVFGVGVLTGLALISKLVEYLISKYEQKTFYGVLGFIYASIIALPISTYLNIGDKIVFKVPHILIGMVLLFIGVAMSYKLGDKK